jgi:outer membrane protein assembly factor BamE (lipoprotein component of BamABCDE complex)
MRKSHLLLLCLLCGQILFGCAYKPDVQQGNTFDDEKLSQLKIGMSQQQVVFIMGTALLKDPFHKNRWDYVYTFAKGQKKADRRLLTLNFDKGILAKIDDSQLKKITLE